MILMVVYNSSPCLSGDTQGLSYRNFIEHYRLWVTKKCYKSAGSVRERRLHKRHKPIPKSSQPIRRVLYFRIHPSFLKRNFKPYLRALRIFSYLCTTKPKHKHGKRYAQKTWQTTQEPKRYHNRTLRQTQVRYHGESGQTEEESIRRSWLGRKAGRCWT